MEYTIIEDHSPYYITFTYPGFEDMVNYCKKFSYLWDLQRLNPPFNHIAVAELLGKQILKTSNLPKELDFIPSRVSFFSTHPGGYYRVHKDGNCVRAGINIPIQILDDKCVTQWYPDEDLERYPIDPIIAKKEHPSRESLIFHHKDKENCSPLKKVSFREGECILFNTDIYHDFDNTQSEHQRVVLTLRVENHGDMYFDDFKRILFKS